MIELNETFSTTMVLEDIIIPNSWNIHVTLTPNTGKAKHYNKAMERLQYYIHEILDNSIFIGTTNTSKLSDLPFKAQVHIFPDDPWDHLVAICLFTKFNAILEEVFFVDSVTISSSQARGISHSYSEEDGGADNLLSLFDDEAEQEVVKYWFKPSSQLFLLHEGLKLESHTWEEVDLGYETKTGTVVTLKDFKKPPKGDNDDLA